MRIRAIFTKRLVLAVALAIVFGAPVSARASGIFGPGYGAKVTFADAGSGYTPAGIAFDGTNYWSVDAGTSLLTNQALYDGTGSLVNTYAPGLDFRSIFTDASGGVFARQMADSAIYQQTSPGVFVPTGVTLADPVAPQAQVVLSGDKTEYVSMVDGVVYRWDLAGNSLTSVPLAGFGADTQDDYPQNRAIAAVGDYWLTYDNQKLTAWDHSGNLAGSAILHAAGTSFGSNYSLSFANGMAFVYDGTDGLWRGYDIFGKPIGLPEPGSLTLLILGLASCGGAAWRKRRRPAQH